MWFKYPYTSYSELNLDWFLSQFKELLEKWDAQKVDYEQFKLDVTTEFNTLSGKFDNLKDAFDDLKTFIENYFDDLDVQQEINNKLDQMTIDGSLEALIAPLVGTDIQSTVTTWLNTHVDPVGSAVVVDDTLSITGAAADAKKTGDDIKDLGDAFIEQFGGTVIIDPGTVQVGYYSGNVGSQIVYTSSGGSSAYHIDLTDFIGKTVNVSFTTTSTGGRKTSLCDSSGIIAVTYPESAMTIGGWNFNITAEDHDLYISFDTVRTSDFTVTCTEAGIIPGTFQALDDFIGNTPMGTAAQTITGAIAEVNQKAELGGETDIIPDKFPTLPYGVVQMGDGSYKIKDDILADKNISGYIKYYVDSVNGDDSNPGTEASPYKTIKKAMLQAIGVDCVITLAEGSVFWDDDLYGEWPERANLVIIGNHAKLYWAVKSPGWTAVADPGIYVSADLTSKPCSGCVDMDENNLDMYGLYKGMKPVASYAALTENTYFWDNDAKLMYIYPRTGADINNIHPIRSSYGWRWNALTSTRPSFLYFKDIDYIGNAFEATKTSSIQYKVEVYYEGCIFQHCPVGDLYPTNDRDICYMIDCIGGYTKQDVFNHHMTLTPDADKLNSIAVEINCQATEAGWYDMSNNSNNNLYTAHDGMNILRCNCNGNNAEGPLIADVNGCRSYLRDCSVLNNSYTNITVNNGCIHFNNVSNFRPGLATLIDVFGGDVARLNTPILVSACDIEIHGGNTYTNSLITGQLALK